MTDTTNKSRELFNFLKREGEEWNPDEIGAWGYVTGKPNPDFFSPPSDKEWQNFGWLWNRLYDNSELEKYADRYIKKVSTIGGGHISCVSLAEALYSWFEGQKGENNGLECK